MKRTDSLQLFLLSGQLLLFLCLEGCSPHLGPTIGVPKVPVPPAREDGSQVGRAGLTVALGRVRDARPAQNSAKGQERSFTEPRGGEEAAVQEALIGALDQHGMAVRPAGRLILSAEIRRWRAEVVTKTTSAISSEAALYVELSDKSGSRVYSGTYHGTRKSEFPISSASDVQESLGLAMSQAIEQVFNDEEFITAIWQKQ